MKEEFKITKLNSFRNEVEFETVIGQRILINKIHCFIFKEEEETEQGTIEGFNITHLETGLRVCNNLSKKECINLATLRFQKWPLAIYETKEKLKNLKIKFPVNK